VKQRRRQDQGKKAKVCHRILQRGKETLQKTGLRTVEDVVKEMQLIFVFFFVRDSESAVHEPTDKQKRRKNGKKNRIGRPGSVADSDWSNRSSHGSKNFEFSFQSWNVRYLASTKSSNDITGTAPVE
jgi:hypothetical protein